MATILLSLTTAFVSTYATIEAGVDLEHDFEAGSSPCLFAAQSTLVSLPGATFAGGGEILNQCSNFFGLSGRSGDEFLAYNTFTEATGPFQVTYDKCCTGGVEMYVASNGPSVTIQGFDDNDVLLESKVVAVSTTWTLVKILQTVKRVVVTFSNCCMVIDDLVCFAQHDTCDALDYVYVTDAGPVTQAEAQAICQDRYGADLATFTNDDDFNEILTLIGGDVDGAWVGLYSPEEPGFFGFINGFDDCVDPFVDYGICIDGKYWLNGVPANICPEEMGSKCVNIKGGDIDKVDNDIDCETRLNGFVCNTGPYTSSARRRLMYDFEQIEDNQSLLRNLGN